MLPLRARVVRVLAGADRPDYVLCHPERPIPFRTPPGFDRSRAKTDLSTTDARGELIGVQSLVVCTRMVGDAFRVGMTDLAINIAYVLDNSLTRETTLDFSKVEYAAIGFVDDSPVELPLPGEAIPAPAPAPTATPPATA